jgi:hypothetical protein
MHIRGEGQSSGRSPAVNQLLKPILDNGDDSLRQQRDLAGINVGTRHRVTERRQARTGRETHVSGTYHGNLGHRMSVELVAERMLPNLRQGAHE